MNISVYILWMSRNLSTVFWKTALRVEEGIRHWVLLAVSISLDKKPKATKLNQGELHDCIFVNVGVGFLMVVGVCFRGQGSVWPRQWAPDV